MWKWTIQGGKMGGASCGIFLPPARIESRHERLDSWQSGNDRRAVESRDGYEILHYSSAFEQRPLPLLIATSAHRKRKGTSDSAINQGPASHWHCMKLTKKNKRIRETASATVVNGGIQEADEERRRPRRLW